MVGENASKGSRAVKAAVICTTLFVLSACLPEDGESRSGSNLEEDRSQKAKFEGQYKGGKRHGRGVLRFANGDRYEGGFVDGEISGKGVLYLANGTSMPATTGSALTGWKDAAYISDRTDIATGESFRVEGSTAGGLTRGTTAQGRPATGMQAVASKRPAWRIPRSESERRRRARAFAAPLATTIF